ncbi:MAG: hypothetical protein MO852_10270 [Candidatus Devosia euplotis]|nr:hypothetical protein [Candidatus Devosia euplotis]
MPTEEEAKAIKAQLDGGADFATMAQEKSIDPAQLMAAIWAFSARA